MNVAPAGEAQEIGISVNWVGTISGQTWVICLFLGFSSPMIVNICQQINKICIKNIITWIPQYIVVQYLPIFFFIVPPGPSAMCTENIREPTNQSRLALLTISNQSVYISACYFIKIL